MCSAAFLEEIVHRVKKRAAPCSRRIVDVNELTSDTKLPRYTLCQRLHAVTLRGVMTAGEKRHATLARQMRLRL